MNDKYDTIKKEMIINAPVENIYSALITPQQLTQWFPNIVTIEPKIGGKISFRFLKESTQEDKDHEIVGEIVSFIPNKELSYTWNFTTKPEYNKNTIVTWKLEQLDKDKTKFTLIHSGFTNADRLQYDDHNKGWSWHIKRLENLMIQSTTNSDLTSENEENKIQNHNLIAIYRLPKKNHDVMVSIFKQATDMFKRYGVLNRQIFQLTDNIADMGPFVNITKITPANQDDEIWIEILTFKNSKHKEDVMSKIRNEDVIEQGIKQVLDHITSGSKVFIGGFDRLKDIDFV